MEEYEELADELSSLRATVSKLEAKVHKLENTKCGLCGEHFSGDNAVICYLCMCDNFKSK